MLLAMGVDSVEVIPFTHIQEEIRDKCPEEFFTLIMRRFMMRLAQSVAQANGCGALITGENLGQVASQTMEAIGVTQECISLPILRPLIGFDKAEIVARARQIGTFELSTLPYEDCCTVFTPRHPRTHPSLPLVLEAERGLDREALIERAMQSLEVRLISRSSSRWGPLGKPPSSWMESYWLSFSRTCLRLR